MVDLEALLPILLYLALIVLVVFLIVFVIKLIKTLDKVDNVVDDVNRKLVKMDGLFELIDHTTDYAAGLSDKIVNGISTFINRLFKRKKGN